MPTATHIPIELYLHSTYEPDADYVDGEIEERNVGEYDHNSVQQALQFWFRDHEKEWNVRAIQEQRMRVSATRVRIPDVCVFYRGLPIEQVFTKPPLLCIEVLSPEDRVSRVEERIEDFLSFGVKSVWVIDPGKQAGWDCSSRNWVRTDHFTVPGTPVQLSLAE
jgi:Uma2 family endonuclease